MTEIFLLQLLAAAVGAVSTALADWSLHNRRIGRRSHGLWVATSIAVISLPVVAWISYVFLGAGLFGTTAAGVVVGMVFCWVYCHLPTTPFIQQTAAQRRSSGVVPPASKFNR